MELNYVQKDVLYRSLIGYKNYLENLLKFTDDVYKYEFLENEISVVDILLDMLCH